MRTGLGLNWLSDNLGSEFGFNFTYKGDLFPMDPLVISAELDLGKTGSSNLAHVRVTTGMNYRHAEIFAGYDHFRLGETEFDGFVSGLRIWFSTVRPTSFSTDEKGQAHERSKFSDLRLLYSSRHIHGLRQGKGD